MVAEGRQVDQRRGFWGLLLIRTGEADPELFLSTTQIPSDLAILYPLHVPIYARSLRGQRYRRAGGAGAFERQLKTEMRDWWSTA
jgi:hypothetical protein